MIRLKAEDDATSRGPSDGTRCPDWFAPASLIRPLSGHQEAEANGWPPESPLRYPTTPNEAGAGTPIGCTSPCR